MVTEDEALWISRNRLPGEPGGDELTRWRNSMPPAEPERKPRGLDTAPAPEVDWAAVIRGALKAERSIMSEIVGKALGQYGDELFSEIEVAIATAVDQLRTELRAEIEQLRSELSGRIDSTQTHGAELRAELEKVIARKRARKAAKPNGEGVVTSCPVLQLPAPNSDAHGTQ
jgi:hypothetical protein